MRSVFGGALLAVIAVLMVIIISAGCGGTVISNPENPEVGSDSLVTQQTGQNGGNDIIVQMNWDPVAASRALAAAAINFPFSSDADIPYQIAQEEKINGDWMPATINKAVHPNTTFVGVHLEDASGGSWPTTGSVVIRRLSSGTTIIVIPKVPNRPTIIIIFEEYGGYDGSQNLNKRTTILLAQVPAGHTSQISAINLGGSLGAGAQSLGEAYTLLSLGVTESGWGLGWQVLAAATSTRPPDYNQQAIGTQGASSYYFRISLDDYRWWTCRVEVVQLLPTAGTTAKLNWFDGTGAVAITGADLTTSSQGTISAVGSGTNPLTLLWGTSAMAARRGPGTESLKVSLETGTTATTDATFAIWFGEGEISTGGGLGPS